MSYFQYKNLIGFACPLNWILCLYFYTAQWEFGERDAKELLPNRYSIQWHQRVCQMPCYHHQYHQVPKLQAAITFSKFNST